MKQIYKETYKKPYPSIKDSYLPTLPSVEGAHEVKRAEIMAEGIVEHKDGEQWNFIDLRIFIKRLPNKETKR